MTNIASGYTAQAIKLHTKRFHFIVGSWRELPALRTKSGNPKSRILKSWIEIGILYSAMVVFLIVY